MNIAKRESEEFEPADIDGVDHEIERPETDWSNAYEMSKALRQFSKGLKDIFWGTMALMGGIVWIIGVPLLAANGGFDVGSLALILFGVWKLIVGKQACWECSLAIRQRWLLNVSFAADLILFALRMARRIGKISWIAVLEAICGLVSFWFLVRFIYHLAQIIDSKWGHRLSIIVMNSLVGGVGVLVATVSLLELRLFILPAPVLGLLLLASLATIFVSFVLFLALAWQMSRDLDRFASFLLTELVLQNETEE